MKSILGLLQDRELSRERFREAFFSDFPETHENREAFEQIAVRSFQERDTGGELFGLCLRNKNVSISDVLYALEDLDDVPAKVRRALPEQITKEEWQAIIRVAVLVTSGLEIHTPPPVMDLEVS